MACAGAAKGGHGSRCRGRGRRRTRPTRAMGAGHPLRVDAAATTFLLTAWHVIRRADGDDTRRLATKEDDTRAVGTILLVSICMASLLGVGFALILAGDRTGAIRAALIAMAGATIALSWTMLNTVYALRYADLYYRSATGGIGVRRRRRTDSADLPRLRLCRVHDRHDLPGLRHIAPRPQTFARRCSLMPPSPMSSASSLWLGPSISSPAWRGKKSRRAAQVLARQAAGSRGPP